MAIKTAIGSVVVPGVLSLAPLLAAEDASRQASGEAVPGDPAGPIGTAGPRRSPAAIETHTAYVFLSGEHAYKIKKPVKFDFVDFRTPRARHAACAKELALNQRLARDVYLDTLDVVDRHGELVDSVLVMRRLPRDRQLSALVDSGADIRTYLVAVARAMAAFHASTESEPQIGMNTEFGTLFDVPPAQVWNGPVHDGPDPEHMVRLFYENLGQLRWMAPVETYDDLDRVSELASDYASGRMALFTHRSRQGHIRDGHGDLRCESVFCLDDGPRIVDCLEFDDHLRILDGLCDIAFLAVDLSYRGHPTDSDALLAAYREFSGDHYPRSLSNYYMSYWATVRAKVACITTRQGDPRREDPARWMGLARRLLDDGRVRLVLVGGTPGVGKSAVAASVADLCGWAVIRSDEVRREVAPGDYSPEATERTYRTMVERAREAMSLGEPVVLDATWWSRTMRGWAREAAEETSSELVEILCDTDEHTVHERIAQRAALATDVSEATVAVSDAISHRFDPWPSAHLVDTTDRTTAAAEQVMRLIEGNEKGVSR